jgi:hypothetical protein
MPSLFSAKSDLVIASLVLARAIRQVFKCDLIFIRSPCVRQYGIVGNVIDNVLDKGELVVFTFQKTHYRPGFEALEENRSIDECCVAESACMQSCFRLGEDVGLKASGQVDLGERSLVGVVASLLLTASLRTKQLSARDSLQKPMVVYATQPSCVARPLVIVADL